MGDFWRDRLPSLARAVWIAIAGRVLLQLGTGFVLFYASIYFVNEVGISATAVGAAIGSGQIAGIAGRILGGVGADSPRWGRRRVLLISAFVSALADVALFAATNLPLLVVGNWLMGFGVGLYWPAMEAMVADLTSVADRREAYAFTRLADSVGLGLGVILGGMVIGSTGNYRGLFVADGISFIVFAAVIYALIPETRSAAHGTSNAIAGWRRALGDRRLLIFVLVNVLFTMYIAQLQTTMPLYFKNAIIPIDPSAAGQVSGLSEVQIGALFTGHIVFAAIAQLPMLRVLRRLDHTHALMVAAALFGLGFVGTWGAGIVWPTVGGVLVWGAIALLILSLGMVAYTPSASALVIELAPEHLRGIYASINALCWAVGYAIGPPLGGMALDASPVMARQFWLWLALSTGVVIAILPQLPSSPASLSSSSKSR
jgi:MFS family permease